MKSLEYCSTQADFDMWQAEYQKIKERVTRENMRYSPCKIEGLAGGIYSSKNYKSDTVVIYAIGAPIMPDFGNLPDAPLITSMSADVFAPDYYGYGRSDGTFTPSGCMQTLVDAHRFLQEGCKAKNTYDMQQTELHYRKVLFIGRSFGANFTALLPRYSPIPVESIALVSPCIDNKSQGSIPGEETNELFLESMERDGFHHVYRGILDPVWKDHLWGKDEYDAMEHVEHLGNTRVFIGHGKNDPVVHHSKSERYYKRLMERFPMQRNQYRFSQFDGGHGSDTTTPASFHFLKWNGLTFQ